MTPKPDPMFIPGERVLLRASGLTATVLDAKFSTRLHPVSNLFVSGWGYTLDVPAPHNTHVWFEFALSKITGNAAGKWPDFVSAVVRW